MTILFISELITPQLQSDMEGKPQSNFRHKVEILKFKKLS